MPCVIRPTEAKGNTEGGHDEMEVFDPNNRSGREPPEQVLNTCQTREVEETQTVRETDILELSYAQNVPKGGSEKGGWRR